MLLSVRARSIAVCLVWALVWGVSSVSAQTNYYGPNGTEYPIVGSLPGDQFWPDVAITPTNGIVVWQDNATDGDGLGISARRLDGTLSGTLSPFRVNVIGAGNQENARVALLKNGGAAIVWQGGQPGFQHIYARFLNASNIFMSTNDILVSSATNYYQITPAVAVLTNGNVVVVWSSLNQVSSTSMQDVYCQILTTNGAKIGTNFLVNQFTSYNQRTPAVAALKNGGFVIGWISEQERILAPDFGTNSSPAQAAAAFSAPSIDVYARLYNSSGNSVGSEFLVNTDYNPCGNPAVAVASDGSFMMTWNEFDTVDVTNGFDIYARSFTSTGTGGPVIVVNSYTYGDQYISRLTSIGLDYLVTFTSLGQDGSREGVFGQVLHINASNNIVPVGNEFMVNTTTTGPQMQAAVASDGVSQLLAVWTSFTSSGNGFDLFAQRYLNSAAILQPMSAPYVWAQFVLVSNVYQPELLVTWSPVLGLSVTNYQVFVDGSGSPTVIVTSNQWTMTAANGLTASSTHYFQLKYATTDGRLSPISPSASGTTWSGANYYGIPFEWMEEYYGLNFSSWPANPNAPIAPGGPGLYQLFVSGGDPLDSTTWLRQQIVHTKEGLFLTWNTQPGATYQVQAAVNLKSWSNLGSPRFAASTTDSINVGGGNAGYYRIVLLR
jgi:hypothetical protein